MKIKTISIWMPLLLLLFFLPDGILTIRNSDYILNAIFLKKEWLLLLIEIGYKMRNLIGGMLLVYMLLNGVKYVKYNNISIRDNNILVVFSIYSLLVYISTYLNHGDIYNAAITDKYFALPNKATKYKSMDEVNNFASLKEVCDDMQANKEAL